MNLKCKKIIDSIKEQIVDFTEKEQKEILDRFEIIFSKEGLYDPNDDVIVKPKQHSFSTLGLFLKEYKDFVKNGFSIMLKNDGNCCLVRKNNIYVVATFYSKEKIDYRIKKTKEPFETICSNDKETLKKFLKVLIKQDLENKSYLV